MGKEIEVKLAAPDAAALESVFSDARIEQARAGAWQELRMVTEYLDTPDRQIAARKWMLRRRMENEKCVYTVKTPEICHIRGEWESQRETLEEAVREMVRLGAPEELAALVKGGVSRTCGVEFVRRTARLMLGEARGEACGEARPGPGAVRGEEQRTLCEVCLDDGVLLGTARRRPFCEVELELVSGPLEPMLELSGYLQERYGLHEERRSKFVRAAELTD